MPIKNFIIRGCYLDLASACLEVVVRMHVRMLEALRREGPHAEWRRLAHRQRGRARANRGAHLKPRLSCVQYYNSTARQPQTYE